jgi:hypothetical protein
MTQQIVITISLKSEPLKPVLASIIMPRGWQFRFQEIEMVSQQDKTKTALKK